MVRGLFSWLICALFLSQIGFQRVHGLNCYNCMYNQDGPNSEYGRSSCFLPGNIKPCDSPSDVSKAVTHFVDLVEANWELSSYLNPFSIVQKVVGYFTYSVIGVSNYAAEFLWSRTTGNENAAENFVCIKIVGGLGKDTVVHNCAYIPFATAVSNCKQIPGLNPITLCYCKDGKHSKPCNSAQKLTSSSRHDILKYTLIASIFFFYNF